MKRKEIILSWNEHCMAYPIVVSLSDGRILFFQVPNPDESEIEQGHVTVYDTWFARVPSSDKTQPKYCSSYLV